MMSDKTRDLPLYRIRLLMDPWNAPSFEEASGQLGYGHEFENHRLSPFPIFKTRPMGQFEAAFRLGVLCGWAIRRWGHEEVTVEHAEEGNPLGRGFVSGASFDDFRAEIIEAETAEAFEEADPHE